MRPIRPIKTEADYDAALAEIDRLIVDDKEPAKGTRNADRLEILLLLVRAYEQAHYPVDPPDPIDAIKFRMEQQGLTRRDLELIFGSSGRVSEILNRRRALTLDMIRRLHSELGIPLESLTREYELGEPAE